MTGGFDGFAVPTPNIFGYPIEGANGVYYMSLCRADLRALDVGQHPALAGWPRHGRDPRQRGLGAEHGHPTCRATRRSAFAISPGITGLAGALFAHYVRFLAPDSFDVLLSIQFVTIVFVGGLGSLHGAIFGAMFVRLLPQVIAIVRDDLPFGIGRMPGLEPSLFGLVLVLVILFEPGGMYGRWLKLKGWFQALPAASAAPASRRQKAYARSERLR